MARRNPFSTLVFRLNHGGKTWGSVTEDFTTEPLPGKLCTGVFVAKPKLSGGHHASRADRRAFPRSPQLALDFLNDKFRRGGRELSQTKRDLDSNTLRLWLLSWILAQPVVTIEYVQVRLGVSPERKQ
jgi:hypothetical protein